MSAIAVYRGRRIVKEPRGYRVIGSSDYFRSLTAATESVDQQLVLR